MKIFEFVRHYPVPYKPYYDAHFADLLDQGHEVTIFSAGPLDDTRNAKVAEYGLDRLTHRYPATLRHAPAALPAAVRNALRSVRSCRVGLARYFESSSTPAGLKRRFLAALRCSVVHRDEPDLCIIQGLGTAVRFPWLRDVFPRTPVAVYYHGGEVPGTARLDPRLVEDVFERADVVFTNTAFSKRQAVARGCPAERVTVLPVGFDLDEFGGVTGKPSAPPLRLVSAGRLSEEKGLVYALTALRSLVDRGCDEFAYRIVGDGYLRPKLEECVRRSDLSDRVEFAGLRSAEETRKMMRDAHALVLPSVAVGNSVETQACAVQEAMLLGCLVVTTRIGGVPESIPPCMERFTAVERDPDALADALERVYRLDPEERATLAERGRSFVADRYDVSTLNDRMLARVLEGGGWRRA